MMPDEYARLRDEIRAVIVAWCEDAGIDPSSPDQVSACSKQIWVALEESGKLHHGMTYRAFQEAIRNEALLSQQSDGFFFYVKQVKDVKCEAR